MNLDFSIDLKGVFDELEKQGSLHVFPQGSSLFRNNSFTDDELKNAHDASCSARLALAKVFITKATNEAELITEVTGNSAFDWCEKQANTFQILCNLITQAIRISKLFYSKLFYFDKVIVEAIESWRKATEKYNFIKQVIRDAAEIKEKAKKDKKIADEIQAHHNAITSQKKADEAAGWTFVGGKH